MGDSLMDALSRLFGDQSRAVARRTGGEHAECSAGRGRAGAHSGGAERPGAYEAGEAAQKQGNWGEFGVNYDRLGRILKRFEELRSK